MPWKVLRVSCLLMLLFISPCFASGEDNSNQVGVYQIDFGTGNCAENYSLANHLNEYNQEKGWGWTTKPESIRDREAPDNLYRDFIFSHNSAKFRIDLPEGLYKITFFVGDLNYGDHILQITIPGYDAEFPVVHPSVGEFLELSGSVELKKPNLEIHFNSPVKNWVINALTVEPIAKHEEVQIKRKTYLPPSKWEDIASWPNPIQPLVSQFRKDLKHAQPVKPTGLSREDYLKIIQGNVNFFKDYQNVDGAIIDPYKKVEFQYSTPCFALAAATLVVHNNKKDLIEPAAKAMDWATWTLSQGKAADHHEDFFSPQIAHALPLLKPYIKSGRYDKWIKNIRSFDPLKVYLAGPGGGNWNVVALSGEGLYYLMGLRDNQDYMERCIAAEGRFFNSPWGLFTEGPMPYDHFPRIWAADMLQAGYRGKETDKLQEVLDRGALTSLFMQSPTGELPAGGRSAHHQWNEAEQCLTYEIYALKAKTAGDLEMAGVYKRAAHLALSSIARWIRPSGEMWIVKNYIDPSQFHGYEGYSSHSQYNLLPMAMLSIAYGHADKTEDIPENPAPADIGGFVFQIPAPFNKVFANAGGMYLEIDYDADLTFNATGLIRVHKKGLLPQLGPSDALSQYCGYRVPEKPDVTAAIGPAWKNSQGQWISLAEFGRTTHHDKFDHTPYVKFSKIESSPEHVVFQLTYTEDFDGPTRIVENYTLSPDCAELAVTLENYQGPMRLQWPVLADNGKETTNIQLRGSKVIVSLGDQKQRYDAPQSNRVSVLNKKQAFRNGWARLAVAEYDQANHAKIRIQPEIHGN